MVGLDPVTYFVRTITLGLSAEKYGADYYEHGAHPTAVASTEQPVDQAQAETIKSRIKKSGRRTRHRGARRRHKARSLAGLPERRPARRDDPHERRDGVRHLRVPPEKIGVSMGDGGSVTYANREQRRQDFLDDAVNPWLVGLQDSMSLWFPRGRFVKFNTGGFSMSDTKTQAEYFKTATGGKAWMEPSEARALMNMAPLPGIDDQQAPGPQNGGDDVPPRLTGSSAPPNDAPSSAKRSSSATSDATATLTGYARRCSTRRYDMYGGPDKGGWTEYVDPKAFDETLKRKPDLHLLINHEGMPLARTKSGTLRLSTDRIGLHVGAELDRSDPDVQRLEVKMGRGDMDEMSFAFRTVRHEWNNDESERRLLELNLDKGDVSVVNFGASPTPRRASVPPSRRSPLATSPNFDPSIPPTSRRHTRSSVSSSSRPRRRACPSPQRAGPCSSPPNRPEHPPGPHHPSGPAHPHHGAATTTTATPTHAAPVRALERAQGGHHVNRIGDVDALTTKQNEARTNRDDLNAKREAIVQLADDEGRADLNKTEDTEFQELTGQIRSLDEEIKTRDERIAELADEEKRSSDAALAFRRAEIAQDRVKVTNEARMYEKGNGRSTSETSRRRPSFTTTRRAADSSATRQRCGSTPSTGPDPHRRRRRLLRAAAVAVGLRRTRPAGRPTANLVTNLELPPGTDSINIPKIATGAATAIQAADNATVAETDLVDSSVSAGVKTIAGQQDLAIQLIEQSPFNFDQVVFADLAADHATKVNVQVLSGSNSNGQVKGIYNATGVNTVAYTDTTPTVAELYSKMADGIQRIHTNRFLAPQVIVMHPRRWAWLLAATDTTGRPLVVPSGQGPTNAVASFAGAVSQQVVGELQGLPVVTDPSIPITDGTGTNEDSIIVMRASDCILYESSLRTRVLPEVGSGPSRCACRSTATWRSRRAAAQEHHAHPGHRSRRADVLGRPKSPGTGEVGAVRRPPPSVPIPCQPEGE